MNELDVFKILSDSTRVRIINLLYQQELCVCELVDILGLSQPKISKHIAKIRNTNLVKTKRNEQFIYYSLNKQDTDLFHLLSTIISNLQHVSYLQEDNKKLKQIDSFVCSKEL